MLMADGDTLLEEHLPPELAGEAELRYLQWALAHHGGDRKSLAGQPGISERTLYRKLAG
jgi:DNA-binding NtrC family response regulator